MSRFSPGFLNGTTSITPARALVKTWQGAGVLNNLGNTTFTFTGLDFGAADTNLWIVAVIAFKNATARTLSSMTIGGVTATIVSQTNVTGSNGRVALAYAYVPAGGTGNSIACTFSGAFTAATSNGVGLDFYRVVGLFDDSPIEIYNDSTTSPPSHLFSPVPAGGVAFYIGTANNGSAAVSGDFTQDEIGAAYVSGNGRFVGSFQQGSSDGTADWEGSSWSASGAGCSKLGVSFGPSFGNYYQNVTVTAAAGTSTVTTGALPTDVSVGDLIVVGIRDGSDTTTAIGSVTDSLGNTYTQAAIRATAQGTSDITVSMYYTVSQFAGSGVTVSVARASSASVGVCVQAFTNFLHTPVLDQAVTAEGAGATPQITSGTTAVANELVVAFCGKSTTNGNINIASPLGHSTITSGSGLISAMGNDTVRAIGAQVANFTQTAATWGGIILTFK